jgi:endonuclease-3
VIKPEERMRHVLQLLEARYGGDEKEDTGSRDPFRTLIGCILSHRTRDANSGRAAKALFQTVDGPEDILKLDPDELRSLIMCSGFYNQKARNIRAICRALLDEYEGSVPDDRERLMSLPGVGPKTADIVMSHAYQRPAIAVDVHVEKVAKRLGLVHSDAGPEEVKQTLESLAPPQRFRFVDNAFVRHGKEYCRSRNPRCGECPLRAVCGNPQDKSKD